MSSFTMPLVYHTHPTVTALHISFTDNKSMMYHKTGSFKSKYDSLYIHARDMNNSIVPTFVYIYILYISSKMTTIFISRRCTVSSSKEQIGIYGMKMAFST